MKKCHRIVLFAALLAYMATVMIGCSASSFSIEYKIEKTVYSPGDKVRIDVSAKNTGNCFEGNEHSHSTSAALYLLDTNGEQYRIFDKSDYTLPATGECVYYRGDVLELWYYFIIPENAPPGEYDLEIWLYGVKTTIADVLEIQN